MKDKKKVGLVKRIAAGVCALFIVLGSLEMSEAYYADTSGCDYFLPYFNRLLCGVDLISIPDDASNYDSYLIYYFNNRLYCDFFESNVCLKCTNDSFDKMCQNSDFVNGSTGLAYNTDPTYIKCSYSSSDNGKTWSKCSVSGTAFGYININGDIIGSSPKIVGASSDILCSHGEILMTANMTNDGSFISPESYNSSLGYIQDLKRQFLYLEDDAFDLVEDTAASKFTFSDTTSTGLNITDGNWSVRHYMQIEIKKFIQRKDGLVDTEVIQTYDTIYMNEYPAADLKVMYPQKDTLLKLHDESGFDGLSWWESNFLGYITYYNDYFQLVRTNEDGSVEYGGYVKLWQDDKNINYSVTLDENFEEDSGGYVDNVVPGTHGSGGTYEDAEHDADENASNSSGSGSELMGQVNDILSTVTAVPEIFARMFSFLPDWCLAFFGISVALAGAVLVWKTFS